AERLERVRAEGNGGDREFLREHVLLPFAEGDRDLAGLASYDTRPSVDLRPRCDLEGRRRVLSLAVLDGEAGFQLGAWRLGHGLRGLRNGFLGHLRDRGGLLAEGGQGEEQEAWNREPW